MLVSLTWTDAVHAQMRKERSRTTLHRASVEVTLARQQQVCIASPKQIRAIQLGQDVTTLIDQIQFLVHAQISQHLKVTSLEHAKQHVLPLIAAIYPRVATLMVRTVILLPALVARII
jgi:hypothetical protein